MADSGSSGVGMPKLVKAEYERWTKQAKAVLKGRKLWSIVEKGYKPIDKGAQGTTPAQIAEDEKNEADNANAMALLHQATVHDNNLFDKIGDSETAKEIWEILEKAFRSNDRVRKITLQNLRGELEDTKMKAGENVAEYIERVQRIAEQMKKNGEEIKECRVVEKILRSLTDEFENLVDTIEETRDLDVLTVDELTVSLTSFEQRRKKKKEKQGLDEALQAKASLKETKQEYADERPSRGGRGEGSGRRGFGRNYRGRSRGRGQSSQRQKPDVECYNCGKHGHYARDCWAERKVKGKAALAEEKSPEAEEAEKMTLLMVQGESNGSRTMWYIDSGASNHMCGNRDLFVEMKGASGEVSFGDASKVEVKGKGKISFTLKDGKPGMIEDVYYIPDMKSNILSVGQLLEKGHRVYSKEKTLNIEDKNGKIIASVEMAPNRMFKMNIGSFETKCLKVNCQDLAELWHHRFAHLGYGNLKDATKTVV